MTVRVVGDQPRIFLTSEEAEELKAGLSEENWGYMVPVLPDEKALFEIDEPIRWRGSIKDFDRLGFKDYKDLAHKYYRAQRPIE